MLKRLIVAGLVMMSGVVFAQQKVDCSKMTPAELRLVDDVTATCKKPKEKPQKARTADEVRAAAAKNARRVVANFFKDPASVQFRNLSTSLNGAVLCGELNAKNGYGAYTGFKRFYSMWEDESGVLVEGDGAFTSAQFSEVCIFEKTHPLK